MKTLRSPDHVRVFTALGIRFWDWAFDLPITHELAVYAWRRDAGAAPVRAVRGPSGIYSFHDLPGRRHAEYPQRDEAEPERLGPELEYVISVDDPAGQFLPVAFAVTLPLGYRGEFLSGAPGSPPGSAGRAYLFSAPSRPVPAGAVAIRADLHDSDNDRPASWAVVRATLEGHDAVGIADEQGRVLIVAPLPEVDRFALGSPPGAGQGTLGEQEWPVLLTIDYEPAALRFPFANAASLPLSWQTRPSLKSILDEQSDALVIADEGAAAVSEWEIDVRYGEELVLRSRSAEGAALSHVWITAGV